MSARIHHALLQRAQATPDRVAYTFLVDGEREVSELTYGQLHTRAMAVASALAAELEPGDRALLLLPSGEDFAAAFFGCLYAGVLPVPVDPPAPPRLSHALPRLRALQQDVRAKVAFVSPQLRAAAQQLPAPARLRGVAWKVAGELPEAPGPALRAAPTEVAYLQYTSGSTGWPKGAMISHGNVLANVALISREVGVHPDTVGVSWLPCHHDMGLVGFLLVPMGVGCRSVLLSPLHFLQRPARWLEAISRYGGTISGGPNFAYQLCAQRVSAADKERLTLDTWERAMNGAEPVNAQALEAFAAAFEGRGFRRSAFVPCYGLAEATLMVAARPGAPVVRELDPQALERGEARPASPDDAAKTTLVSHGPARGFDVQVVDPATGAPCPPGRVGELWVAGDSVASGYWEKAEASRETFGGRLPGRAGAYLRTGDLGFLEGGELFVTGRLKDLIIVEGRNCYPQDLEQSAEEACARLRKGGVAAFSVPSGAGERVVVVAEVERRQRVRRAQPRAGEDRRAPVMAPASGQGAAELSPEQMRAAVRRALAEHHSLTASDVLLVRAGEIPRTSSGKLQRRECRARYLAQGLLPYEPEKT